MLPFRPRPPLVTRSGHHGGVANFLRWVREAGAAGARVNAAQTLRERRRAEEAVDDLSRRLADRLPSAEDGA